MVDTALEEADGIALDITGLSYAYGARKALDNVSFTVRSGRFTALLGPNGAGKSTLFSLITRLFDTREGSISIAGKSLHDHGASALSPLGVVFQQTTLDLDLSVRQNLRYFARLRGMSMRDANRRIEEELTRFDMADRAKEKVRNLNGGHRRRVEIARALLHDPQVVLLDEPTVGLDVPSRKAIVEYVHQLARERGIALLWATHLIDEIRSDDDLVVLHQGRVVDKGRTSDVIARSGAADLDGAFARLTGRPPANEIPAGDAP
ncbi:Doxorubicin resistance ATP-binding protein DrrA [Hartmannibacter diazotrophicus]|uniref:Doxorubicin resistance ATP-binding protein DrrA n=1 Tax=Hartmannibacter diazotrophicus TaxID=1482074 RepID=A0A2C9D4P4_9HYPH|nr:ABC transporter ATP-binding protein [Hartmannibacter diazotrophicus]SON54465.1 Doxorubicin resistance ATP-binding protein DrrA [Hartmannibacter diazotrophicus]